MEVEDARLQEIFQRDACGPEAGHRADGTRERTVRRVEAEYPATDACARKERLLRQDAGNDLGRESRRGRGLLSGFHSDFVAGDHADDAPRWDSGDADAVAAIPVGRASGKEEAERPQGDHSEQ